MDVDLLELDSSPIDISEDKCTITVEYEGKETQVSWYRGLESKDIEEAILCACDSIIDQGFSLTDSSGFPTPIGQVIPGEKYFIVPGEECKGKERIIGDRLRRLTVEIEPFQHSECRKAIELMNRGSNLLKHTKNSVPHIRLFQTTEDLKYLIWYSSGKSQEKASILLSNINEIKIGQLTETFINYPVPALEHLSFSLIHTKGTLDLTCRDEREFDFWVIGFKAILFSNKELKVSKQVLLSHSRRFTDYLRQNKFNTATSVIYQEPETKKLEECIIRKSLTGEYSEIFLEDVGKEEIYHTEQMRMSELNNSCKTKLFTLESEFSNKYGVPEHHDTAEYEIELWRLEVDVENLNDIINRIERATGEKWENKVKSWFKNIF